MKAELSHPQLEIFRVNRYHRSTKVRDEKVLRHRERKATGQDAIILDFMRLHCMESFSAPQIFRLLSQKHPKEIRVLSSVRRSMSNLANEARCMEKEGRGAWLIKLDETEPGDYGYENHKYQYAGKPSINHNL